MDLGVYTNLTFTGLLILFLVFQIGLGIRALVRWLRAGSLWAQVIKREQLDAQRIWSRVKVWPTTSKASWRCLMPQPVYAMMYVDRESIQLEAQDPVDGQLITTFDRATVLTHWCRDRIEFVSHDTSLQIKAVGPGMPVSSAQQTDAFWRRLQPQCWDPFANESRGFDVCADWRSKLAVLVLGITAILAVIEFVFLNSYSLIESGLTAQLWWVSVFAAMPALIWMMRDRVPALEASAAALMLAVSLSLTGYIGLKRMDQWFGGQAQHLYILAMNGERELVPVDSHGPTIKLHQASQLWNEIALGTQHAVVVRGGALGTSQVNFAQLLPSNAAIR